MVLKVAVIDTDIDYLDRFSLATEEIDDIELSIFSKQENFQEVFSSSKYHIILFNPEVYSEKINTGKSSLPIMLIDELTDIPNGMEDINRINKYQRISNIYHEMLDLYSNNVKGIGEIWNNNKTRILAVYSPVGGAGKTTIAFVLAEKLTQLGYRTLYLNFEDFSTQDAYVEPIKGKGLSELWASMEEKTGFTMKAKSMLHCNEQKLYYFSRFSSPNDIYDIKDDEIEQLINQISKTDLFDVIVIDLNTSAGKQNTEIMRKAEKVVIVETPNAFAKEKLKNFYGQAHIISENKGKMFRIINNFTGNERELDMDIPIIGRINYVRNADSIQLIRALAESDAVQFHEALID